MKDGQAWQCENPKKGHIVILSDEKKPQECTCGCNFVALDECPKNLIQVGCSTIKVEGETRLALLFEAA